MRRNYWVYSIGCGVVWAILLAVNATRASPKNFHTVELLCAGFTIAWVSGTIARYVYGPPRRWLRPDRQTQPPRMTSGGAIRDCTSGSNVVGGR